MAGQRERLIAGVDPASDIVEEIRHGIRVLAGRGLTPCARAPAVGGAFDDDEVLVIAGRHLVMNFIVADEIVGAHGCNQQRLQ